MKSALFRRREMIGASAVLFATGMHGFTVGGDWSAGAQVVSALAMAIGWTALGCWLEHRYEVKT